MSHPPPSPPPSDPDPRETELPAPDPIHDPPGDDFPEGDPTFDELSRLRERQKRDAARGCLLALVLEGAAVLAALLWIVARAAEWPAVQSAAAFAFMAFTIAGVGAAIFLLIVQNLPKHRRLRDEADSRSS